MFYRLTIVPLPISIGIQRNVIRSLVPASTHGYYGLGIYAILGNLSLVCLRLNHPRMLMKFTSGTIESMVSTGHTTEIVTCSLDKSIKVWDVSESRISNMYGGRPANLSFLSKIKGSEENEFSNSRPVGAIRPYKDHQYSLSRLAGKILAIWERYLESGAERRDGVGDVCFALARQW